MPLDTVAHLMPFQVEARGYLESRAGDAAHHVDVRLARIDIRQIWLFQQHDDQVVVCRKQRLSYLLAEKHPGQLQFLQTIQGSNAKAFGRQIDEVAANLSRLLALGSQVLHVEDAFGYVENDGLVTRCQDCSRHIVLLRYRLQAGQRYADKEYFAPTAVSIAEVEVSPARGSLMRLHFHRGFVVRDL
jgi:hypothetical protein